MIVAEHLFVQISEEMEWLGADIGAFESALEETPEVFEAVGVDLTVNVTLGMVDDLMHKIFVQSLIGEKRIGVNRTASRNVISDFALDGSLAAIRNHVRTDFAAALQDSHDRGFVLGASLGNANPAFVLVHEASRAPDEGFVYLDFAAYHSKRFILQGEPDAMQHEPCGLLSDAESAAHFIRANPILAVGEPMGESSKMVPTLTEN